MTTLVIARFNEPMDWLKDVPQDYAISLYSKGDTCAWWHIKRPNVGRETETYLYHIITHYNLLSGDTIFCQGDPFPHDPNFMANIENESVKYYGQLLKCNPNGLPHCDWTPLHPYCELLGLPKKDEYKFVAGAQYRVTANQIRSRPIEFYKALIGLANTHEFFAWCVERLFVEIFKLEL